MTDAYCDVTRDCNPGLVFPIPGLIMVFGNEDIVIPKSAKSTGFTAGTRPT